MNPWTSSLVRLLGCFALVASLLGCKGGTPSSPSPTVAPSPASKNLTVLSGSSGQPLQGVSVRVDGGEAVVTDDSGKATLASSIELGKSRLQFSADNYVPSVQLAKADGAYTLIGPLDGISMDFINQFMFHGNGGELLRPLNNTIVIYLGDSHPLMGEATALLQQGCASLVNDLGVSACRVTTQQPALTEGTILSFCFDRCQTLWGVPPMVRTPKDGDTGNVNVCCLADADAFIGGWRTRPATVGRFLIDRNMSGFGLHSFPGLAGTWRVANPPLEFGEWERRIARLYLLRQAGSVCFPDTAC